MANLESPLSENLQEFESGAPENGESLEVVNIDLPFDVYGLDTKKDALQRAKGNLLRSEVQPSLTRNDLKRKAPLYHKGVHLKQSNKKFVARLCLPGGKKKLELGEYQSQEEAARAYDVGAFYYQRFDCSCLDRSFQDKLSPVRDNISEGEKRRWVRERARQSARQFASFLDLERRTSASDRDLRSGCSSLFSSQLEEQPSTPASRGTQEASFGNPTDTPTPVTSVSDADNFLSGPNDHDVELSFEDLDVTSMNRRKRKAVPYVAYDATRGTPTSSPVSRRPWPGLSFLEEQQERNTHKALPSDKDQSHQAIPQLKMTDSILFAQCELRKQGWVLTLKPSSPSSAKTRLLFSLPQSQHVPALLITDIIISSFYELREQGWEVHLEASKCDSNECREKEHRENSSISQVVDALASPRAAASPRPLPRMNMSPSSTARTSLSSPKYSFMLPDHNAAVIVPNNSNNTTDVFHEDNSYIQPFPELGHSCMDCKSWWDCPHTPALFDD